LALIERPPLVSAEQPALADVGARPAKSAKARPIAAESPATPYLELKMSWNELIPISFVGLRG